MIPLWENCLTLPTRMVQKLKYGGIVQHRVFCNIPRKPLKESSIMPLEGHYEPMSKEKVSKFSLVGKQLLGETKFPFDIRSKKDL